MRLCLLYLVLGLTLGTPSGFAKPVASLRLLKTDQTTAGFLRDAIATGLITPREMEDRLDQLQGRGKVSELARFQQAFSSDGERIELKKGANEVEIADGELMPVGILLEIEPHIGPRGLVDLRLAFDHSVSVRKNRIDVDRTLTGVTVKADTWEILAAWGDGPEETLLMAHFSGVEMKDESRFAMRSIREVCCRSELILCTADDLKTFGRSTPATRTKAVAWLKERGERVTTSELRVRSGQKATQQNVLQWIHDANGWDTAELGLAVEVEPRVGPAGKRIDLRLAASWHPRDAKRPPAAPLGEFRLADTISSGATQVVEPATRPDEGPVPVLFVTPLLDVIQESGPAMPDAPEQ